LRAGIRSRETTVEKQARVASPFCRPVVARVQGSDEVVGGFRPPDQRIPGGWIRFFRPFGQQGGGSLTTQSENKEQRVRVNRQIRISPVRLIGADGAQLGIVALEEAFRVATESELDLVEVAPLARPPVVKVMDYGKYRFEQAKAARAAKKKQHVIQMKEVKYRPGIDDHDFAFKTRHARDFLEEGNKVKLTMMFRGRQVAHPELGRVVLDRVVQALQDVGKIEVEPKLEGRNMSMVVGPR